MAASAEIERLRRKLDAQPGDDEARAALAALLLAAGDRAAAADAFYLAACGARRRGDEDPFRERLRSCLLADESYPLLFTEPPPAGPMPHEAWARLLVVHPESRVRAPLVRLFGERGYLVDEAATVGSPRPALRQAPSDLVLTAPQFVDGEALQVATAARRARPTSAVVLLTCAAKGERIASGAELGPLVDEHLDRPLAPERLLEAVRAALWRHRHARSVVPGPPLKTGGELFGVLPRVLLLVAAGYAVILATHAFLASTRSAMRPAEPEVRSASPTPPLDEGELWRRLTTTHGAPGVDLAVTRLTPALLAARAARRGAAPATIPPGVLRLELHLSLTEDLEVDPEQVARSVRLRAGDRPPLAPLDPPAGRAIGLVREARPGGPPRVRGLSFTLDFGRAALGRPEVAMLTLEVGGRTIIVFMPRPEGE